MARGHASLALALALACAPVARCQEPSGWWDMGNTTDMVIDLLNLRSWPWGATYRFMWRASNSPIDLRFTCSASLEWNRVNDVAFNGCTLLAGSGGDTIPSLSSQFSSSVSCVPTHSDPTDRQPISLPSSTSTHTQYYMSLTNGTGTRVGGGGGPAQGGVCQSRGAKVAVEFIPTGSPLLASGGAYSCAGVACPVTEQCRFRPCRFGSCFPSQLLASGAACDDGNPLTSNDLCNGAGECAGTANFTFVLRFAQNGAAWNPVQTTQIAAFQVQNILINQGFRVGGVLPANITDAMSSTIVETFGADYVDIEFTLSGYRNYQGGSDSLASELNAAVGQSVFFRGASRTITSVVSVSATPTLAPTTAPPTAAPTAAGAGGTSDASSGSDNVVAGVENMYLYAAAAAVVVIIIGSLVFVCRRRSGGGGSRNRPIKPRAGSTMNPTYAPEASASVGKTGGDTSI